MWRTGNAFARPHICIVQTQNLTNAQATSYSAQGFEVGLHINTNCADFTPASLDTFYSQQIAAFSSSLYQYPDPVHTAASLHRLERLGIGGKDRS